MRKIVLFPIKAISICISIVVSFWLVSASIFLLLNGGTDSLVEDAAVICGIPIFTEDTRLWTLFELYGVPLIILVASWQTAIYCSKNLKNVPPNTGKGRLLSNQKDGLRLLCHRRFCEDFK